MTVELENITKRFGNVVANDGVSLQLRPGTIHALLGENGAGKSTLMNVLYGLLRPDSGVIRLEGEEVVLQRPIDAIEAGIGMVHQDFLMIPRLSVAENVILGLRSGVGVKRGSRLDLQAAFDRISELSAMYGLEVAPASMVGDLSVGEQQRVEIMKLLFRDAKVLILDEPTGVLTKSEAENLFKILGNLKSSGRSVLLITHKMNEVFSHSDDITVMRAGRVVLSGATTKFDAATISTAMVGTIPVGPSDHGKEMIGDVLLRVEGVHACNDRGVERVRGVSIQVRTGEVVGIAGVEGNGQPELVSVITGNARASRGSLFLAGEDVSKDGTRRLRDKGVCYVPADRRGVGSIADWSLVNNVALGRIAKYLNKRILVRRERMAADLDGIVDRFSIRTGGPNSTASMLSGGNLQKVILGRELIHDPMLVVAEQPTRGLDIASTSFVRNLLRETAAKGRAVLLISADLDEVIQVCDRFVVMHQGRITGEFRPETATSEDIGLAMGGRTS